MRHVNAQHFFAMVIRNRLIQEFDLTADLQYDPAANTDRRLSVPQSRFGRYGEEKIRALTETKIRPLSRPARSQSLCRLRSPGSQSLFVQMKNKK
jgi:hypothetical protein